MSNKKQKLDLETQFKKLCTRLSPNNIVFDILTYHVFYFKDRKPNTNYAYYCGLRTYSTNIVNHGPGDLFGTFKLDRLRNVWMIFRCVHFSDCLMEPKNWPIYMNPMKLISLSLEIDSFIFNKLFYSREFTNLISLRVYHLRHFNKLEMNWELFPKLKCLDIITKSSFPVIQLKGCKYKQFKNLYLHGICQDFNYLINYHFPMNENFENLETFRLYKCSIRDDFFIKNSFPVLKYLQFNGCFLIQGNWKPYNLEWIKNLKKLAIIDCEGITDKFFETNSFPKLKFLYIRWCDDLTYINKTWNVFTELKILRIECCRFMCNNIIECCLHQNSNFPKLRKLIIKECESVRFSSRLVLLASKLGNLSKTIERISIIQCGDNLRTSITWPILTREEKKHF